MFETLLPVTDEQVKKAARTLQEGSPVFFMVDPSETYMVFTPSPNHEVDFGCVTRDGDAWKDTPLTPLQHSVIHVWTEDTWKKVHKEWILLDKETPNDDA